MIIDIGSRFNGYWGDYTRTWICGDKAPSKELVKLHMRAYDGLKRAQKAIKPGATTEEVALACGNDQILNRSLGHGIGVGANDAPFIGLYPGVTGKDARKLGGNCLLDRALLREARGGRHPPGGQFCRHRERVRVHKRRDSF